MPIEIRGKQVIWSLKTDLGEQVEEFEFRPESGYFGQDVANAGNRFVYSGAERSAVLEDIKNLADKIKDEDESYNIRRIINSIVR